jgi:hypothetical protein
MMSRNAQVLILGAAILACAGVGSAQYTDAPPRKSFAPWPAGMADFGDPARPKMSLVFKVAGEHPSVAMTSADVVITLNANDVDIAAIFDFENDGPACDVGICLPLTFTGVSWKKQPPDYTDAVIGTPLEAAPRNFQTFSPDDFKVVFDVTVDGKPAAVAFDIRGFEIEEGHDIGGVARIPTRFEAGQSRRVACHYKASYNEEQTYKWTEYVVSKAAAWKGPIGHGRITMKPGPGVLWTGPLIYEGRALPPARDAGGEVVWEFEDFEPTAQPDANYKPDTDFGGICPANYYYDQSERESARYSTVTATLSLTDVVFDAGFPKSFTPCGIDVQVPPVPGSPAIVSATALNLRTTPDGEAEKVKGRPPLKESEGIVVLERRGEWFRVTTFSPPRLDPAEPKLSVGPGDLVTGWVKWHAVDAGAETLYVKFIDASL